MLDDTVKELLTNEHFVNWVRSEDDSKNQYWIDWLAKNPEKKKAFQEAQQLVRSMKYEDVFKMSDSDDEDLYYSLRRHFLHSHDHKPKVRYWLSGAAASFLLIAGLVVYFMFYEKAEKVDSPPYKLVEKSTEYGTKLTVTLPDGSTVKLNAGSYLSFRTPFRPDAREVTLVGEAYFEVTKDLAKPFIVKTKSVETTVLGTAFNVSAYEDDDLVNVALVTGMVKVNIIHPLQKIEKILNPLEMMIFSKEHEKVTVKNFDVEQVTGWKDQVIYFEKESLPKVVDILEKWYGVEIIISNPKGRKWNYTGKFKGKSLEHVLLRMSYTEGFTYKIENNKVTININ